MTLGDLRKLTKDLPDDTKIITISDNFELEGNMVEARSVSLAKVRQEKKWFTDDFDYTDYCSTVYVYDDDGEDALYI